MRKGPLNSYVDPTEFGAGSAILEVSEAVKASGGYDAWADVGGERGKEVKDGMETVSKVKVKVSCPRLT
jgi:nucleolar protein 53